MDMVEMAYVYIGWSEVTVICGHIVICVALFE